MGNKQLIRDVAVRPRAFSPNGDGVNDQIALDYILLKATAAVGVQVIIYDLSGREVRRLYDALDRSGPTVIEYALGST